MGVPAPQPRISPRLGIARQVPAARRRPAEARPRRPRDRAARWGLLSLQDPDLNGEETVPFWRADAVPPPVSAGARKAPAPGGPLFDLWAEPGGKAVALTPEGAYVVIEAGTRTWRLLFAEPEELRDRLPLVVHMGDVVDDEAARAAALRFLDRARTAPAAPGRFVPGNAQRLMMQLQALDGDLAGAGLREIAEAVFGSAAVADDWPRYRSRTRTLIRRGRWLMEGGYRTLLIPLRSRGSRRLRRLARPAGRSGQG